MWQDIQPLWVIHTLHLETSGENPRVFFVFSNVKPLIFVQKIMPKVS